MSSKTAEVRALTALHSENASLNINPLSMLLSGLIDAAVGGGIKNYRLVFFNNEYAVNNPDHMERVKRLKQLIEEQVCVWEYVCECDDWCGCGCVQIAVLRKGLDLHGKRIAPALKAMQQNLEARLEMMVSEVFPERRNKTKKVRDPLSMSFLCHTTSLLPQPSRSYTVKNVPLPPTPMEEWAT